MQRHDPTRDLAGEYLDKYKAEPKNGALAYLAARLVSDPAEQAAIHNAAIKDATPNAFLHHGIAYNASLDGDFQRALEHWEKAMKLEPDNQMFSEGEGRARLALGHYDELIKRQREAAAADPQAMYNHYVLVKLLAMKGDPAGAKRYMRDKLRLLDADPEVDDETVAYWRSMMQMALSLATDDFDAVAPALRAGGIEEDWWYTIGMIEGRWANLLKNAQEGEDEDAINYLLIYAGASHAGDTQVAQTALDKAVSLLRERGQSDRKLADWFAGQGDVPDDAQQYMHYQSDELRVALVALATRYPEKAQVFLPLARLHNHDPVGYYPAIVRLLAK